MSYHNDPYRVDYLKIYPCLKERPDVLEVLKKSDRKMKYMEVDLKIDQRRKNAENGAESYVSSKEDSLERLIYSAKCQFADDAEGVEDAVIRKDNLRRLRAALDQLSEEERVLIHALFFDERSERALNLPPLLINQRLCSLKNTAQVISGNLNTLADGASVRPSARRPPVRRNSASKDGQVRCRAIPTQAKTALASCPRHDPVSP